MREDDATKPQNENAPCRCTEHATVRRKRGHRAPLRGTTPHTTADPQRRRRERADAARARYGGQRERRVRWDRGDGGDGGDERRLGQTRERHDDAYAQGPGDRGDRTPRRGVLCATLCVLCVLHRAIDRPDDALRSTTPSTKALRCDERMGVAHVRGHHDGGPASCKRPTHRLRRRHARTTAPPPPPPSGVLLSAPSSPARRSSLARSEVA